MDIIGFVIIFVVLGATVTLVFWPGKKGKRR